MGIQVNVRLDSIRITDTRSTINDTVFVGFWVFYGGTFFRLLQDIGDRDNGTIKLDWTLGALFIDETLAHTLVLSYAVYNGGSSNIGAAVPSPDDVIGALFGLENVGRSMVALTDTSGQTGVGDQDLPAGEGDGAPAGGRPQFDWATVLKSSSQFMSSSLPTAPAICNGLLALDAIPLSGTKVRTLMEPGWPHSSQGSGPIVKTLHYLGDKIERAAPSWPSCNSSQSNYHIEWSIVPTGAPPNT